ncbi:hypothetical protein M413DRAFT_22159 [Hebeloma cylindrosporum]|uniref:Uncharacterized protein n=1 Tax=Hebeloma cylindrosporum TaxID=76867 RepID=A0A0C3CFJ0_HEBCY|nr:hypothetical protein M413DRAFT_22159 [Hebeloma cylindrosporum h7]
MYCVGYTRPAFRSSACNSCRFQSTRPVPKPLAVTSFKNVVIPSREEILSKTPAVFRPDISYLKHGSSKSLASRLAQPRLRSQEKSRAEARAEAAARAKAKAEEPEKLSPDALSEITERRKAQRLARLLKEGEAALSKTTSLPVDTMLKSINKPSQTEEPPQLPSVQLPSVQAIGSAPSRSATDRHPRPKAATELHRVPRLTPRTHPTAEQRGAVSDSIAKRKAEREARLQRKAGPQKEAAEFEANTHLTAEQRKTVSESIAKRKAEREARLQREAAEFEANGYQPARMGSKRSNTRRQEKKVFFDEPVEEPEVEAGGEVEGYRPQFTAPPAPSNLLDIFSIPYRPSSGQDYSRYTTHVPNAFSTPPDMLGAIRFAEIALTRQRSIALPQRVQAMGLISHACAAKSRRIAAS